MKNLLTKFRKNNIPVIDWNFFASLKEGREFYNDKNWSGWNPGWVPIASNVMGDAIILYNDAVYEVKHGTGEEPRPTLVTNDIAGLESFFIELKTYKGYSENDSIDELREKKELLLQLKKFAPRSLKYDFTLEIDDIKETISDIRFDNSKEGKFLQAAKQLQKTAMAELRENGRYSAIRLLRRENKLIFYITGSLKRGESLEEIKNVISKYTLSYPVEYDDFKTVKK
jgi:hypothetical protein